jgi:hypothetical protein
MNYQNENQRPTKPNVQRAASDSPRMRLRRTSATITARHPNATATKIRRPTAVSMSAVIAAKTSSTLKSARPKTTSPLSAPRSSRGLVGSSATLPSMRVRGRGGSEPARHTRPSPDSCQTQVSAAHVKSRPADPVGTPLALLMWVVVAVRSSGRGTGLTGGQTPGTSVIGSWDRVDQEASCCWAPARTAPRRRPQLGPRAKARP